MVEDFMPKQQFLHSHFGTHVPPACLIIEDSAFDQLKLQRMINRSISGMQVYMATTLQEARRTLVKHPVSMILLDNDLPDGIGADFAVELAELKVFSHIAVIMLSDWPSPFMWEKAATAGVLHVLNKSEFSHHYLLDAFNHAQKAQPRLQ
jgi:DNA-binding NarL/FixJ family response regulator